MSRQTFIYFLRPVGAEGPIKIGCSNSPERRLRHYLPWSPLPLEIVHTMPGDMKLERNIQECFADAHMHHEWFAATPRLVAFLDKLVAGVAVGDAVDLSDRRGKVRQPSRARRTPEAKEHCSYVHKIRHAEERATKAAGERMLAPREIAEILCDARRYDRGQDRSVYRALTKHERARLDEYLADPVRHGVRHTDRYPERNAA